VNHKLTAEGFEEENTIIVRMHVIKTIKPNTDLGMQEMQLQV
jgi:hypothetical protein